MKLWKKILEKFFHFLPNFENLMKLGFKAKVRNQDFILTKNYSQFSIDLYQGIDIKSVKFRSVIDFDIPYACIVIDFKNNREILSPNTDLLHSLCDFTYDRQNHFFLFDEFMELEDRAFAEIVKKIEKILNFR